MILSKEWKEHLELRRAAVEIDNTRRFNAGVLSADCIKSMNETVRNLQARANLLYLRAAERVCGPEARIDWETGEVKV